MRNSRLPLCWWGGVKKMWKRAAFVENRNEIWRFRSKV